MADNTSDILELHEPRPVRLATVFSGIGAIEQAFLKMGIAHEIVFACDNGERELLLLSPAELREYKSLKKDKEDDGDKAKRLKELESAMSRRLERRVARVLAMTDRERRRLYVERLYARYAQGKPNLVHETYTANYAIRPEDFHTDIRFMNGADYAGGVDIMVGGSPCQSFSSNGKRAGIDDTRGTLFYEYARLIRDIEPKCFIFENVKGLLVHDSGKTWRIIRDVFRELDYDIYLNRDADGEESPTLNACDYGIPQTRERIYLVGIRHGITLKHPFEFPAKETLTRFVPDFLDDNVDAKYYFGRKGFEFVTTHPTRAQVGSPVMNCQKANQQFNWNGDFIFEPISEKHTPEILARAYRSVWNGREGVIRKFTPRECLRLMGFPDTFRIVVNDTTMYRQTGNSIVVDVLQRILAQLTLAGVFEDNA